MPIRNVLASVAVKDLTSALAWYERILDRAADSKAMEGVAEWRFERGGWLQVYELATRAGSGSFTLAVTSLNEQLARLATLGIDTSHQTKSPFVDTVMITDPDGNHIAFAEAHDPLLAQ